MRAREYITAHAKQRKVLQTQFNSSATLISRSLDLTRNSIKARSIRVYAVNNLFCKLHINKKSII